MAKEVLAAPEYNFTHMIYEPTIGLEIHVQLNTQTKMFCSCQRLDPDSAEANSAICPICLGHPGTLPTLNREAVKLAVMTGLALKGEIQPKTKFDRKHYFYPDLPKGYQISQYDEPIIRGGELTLVTPSGEKTIHFERMHLEEDAAKLIHTADGTTSVDHNRAGTPLLEMVTKPEITNPEEAKIFAETLHNLLVGIRVTEGVMKKGHMRFDVNISVKEKSAEKLGTKVEIKNLNSFRSLLAALNYEIQRQTARREKGETILQETRGWDEASQKTLSQRVKEGAEDYRYFPEPDLPPLLFTAEDIAFAKKYLPELPSVRQQRAMDEFALSSQDAALLAKDPNLFRYFEQTISELRSWLNSLDSTAGSNEEIWAKDGKKLTRLVFGWLTSEILKHMNIDGKKIQEIKITPEDFAEFITLIHQNKVNSSAAQIILGEMYKTGSDPSQILAEKNLEQVHDEGALEKTVEEVMAEETGPVAQYRAGKVNVLMYLVGKIMKKMKGKANPQMVTDMLREKLK